MEAYFDNAATTKVFPEVKDLVVKLMEEDYGNPSSLHQKGLDAGHYIKETKEILAKEWKVDSKEIVLTSGGTESNNLALIGAALANKRSGNRIITSKVEHASVSSTMAFLESLGFEVVYLNVDHQGIVDLEQLEQEVNEDTILVSVMYVNNEIGTIQPIEKIAKIAHEQNITFHTDAVQAIGNMPIDVQKLQIDMLSLSGHKINAPKGIGALYIKNGINVEKYINGGHQERDKRAGTENVAGIVGLGKACERSNKNMLTHIKNLSKLRDYYLSKLEKEIPGKFRINGGMENRLPGNANISFAGINSSELIYKLDEMGICVSSGSACSSGSVTPSHVLTAINVPEVYLNSAIRTTFGDNNTFEQINYLIKCLKKICLSLDKDW